MLEDRVIFITGAAQGIGLGIARAVLEAGGRVALGDLRSDLLPGAATSLASNSGVSPDDILTCVLDVTNEDSVETALGAAREHFGRVDGLVNNAGIIRMGPDIEAGSEDWRAQLDVNVTGVHNCCRVFAAMPGKSSDYRAVVNLASNAGKVGYPDMAAYNASKAAVISLTRTLAGEWAGRNINVNAVCPGGVATAMLREVASAVGKRDGEDPDDLFDAMVPAQLGRHIQPLEIGRVVVFLLSETAAIIRGQSINTDGGDTPY